MVEKECQEQCYEKENDSDNDVPLEPLPQEMFACL